MECQKCGSRVALDKDGKCRRCDDCVCEKPEEKKEEPKKEEEKPAEESKEEESKEEELKEE